MLKRQLAGLQLSHQAMSGGIYHDVLGLVHPKDTQLLRELLGMELISFGLIVVYGGGAWKFWKGFHRTNFSQSFPTRLSLSLLWPVLLVANKSYRRNFNKALKG